MLIKDDNDRNRNSTGQLLAGMQDFGFLSNSEGIQNEVEILKSRILARDVVKDLKLYVEYRSPGRIKNRLEYNTQPVCADLDSLTLANWDHVLLDSAKFIQFSITRLEDGYDVKGQRMTNGKPAGTFSQKCPVLPACVNTGEGVLTLTQNGGRDMKVGDVSLVSIQPPMAAATGYVNALKVEPISRWASIAELTLTEYNKRRGLDFLRQLAVCYNRQANIDKNEIALKTEAFINVRLQKIDSELGSTENALENYKKRNTVTTLSADATQSLALSKEYETKLVGVSSQIQLIDYLCEFVDNPANQYKIIPSNIGMTDPASTALITSYNQTVQERNRYLKTASLQAPQVVTLTSTLDDLQSSIRTALLQARHSTEIQRQSLERQLTKYQGRIVNTPEQERVLTQIGRQQEVKSGLYLLLLQKREENSISLAATADKGKLIDEPLYIGKISPKKHLTLLLALLLGLCIPFVALCLIRLFNYRIDGHEELAQLTKLPVVSDVPVVNDSVKTRSGIVVQANTNNQIDEIFRSMRANIQFMMKETDRVILFTSSISGEGKTFLAANLAMSFALLGKKVILCGLDVRKPALTHLFDIKDRTKGITSLLLKDDISAEDLNANILPSGVNAYLDLLYSGPIPPNPTELLARETLGEIIELLKQRYDYIILDTAPVGLVNDTLEIARYAQVNCYVCRADYTPKASVSLLNTLSEEKKLNNCCVILNGVDMSKKKNGYYYGYGMYGKYGKYGKYGHYGQYGRYGRYGNGYGYGNYSNSHYSKKNDNSIKI